MTEKPRESPPRTPRKIAAQDQSKGEAPTPVRPGLRGVWVRPRDGHEPWAREAVGGELCPPPCPPSPHRGHTTLGTLSRQSGQPRHHTGSAHSTLRPFLAGGNPWASGTGFFRLCVHTNPPAAPHRTRPELLPRAASPQPRASGKRQPDPAADSALAPLRGPAAASLPPAPAAPGAHFLRTPGAAHPGASSGQLGPPEPSPPVTPRCLSVWGTAPNVGPGPISRQGLDLLPRRKPATRTRPPPGHAGLALILTCASPATGRPPQSPGPAPRPRASRRSE